MNPDPETTGPIARTDLQTLLDVVEGYISENGFEAARRYALPIQIEKALHNARAAISETGKPRPPESIITQDSDEVYLYDLERFHRDSLPALEFMDDLLEAGWTIREWEDLDEDEIGEVADRLNLYSEGPDYISPELRQSPDNAAELAGALKPWLIPPETAKQ